MSSSNHFPLRSWRVRNFKSLTHAVLDLAPLTVLVGANSTGKSSLIQSILFVSQAAGDIAPDQNVPLNGPMVELGEFGDVKRSQAGGGETLAVGCTLGLDQGKGTIADSRSMISWDAELSGRTRGLEPGRAELRRVTLAGPVGGDDRFVFTAQRRIRHPVEPLLESDRRAMVPLAGRLETAPEGGRSTLKTIGLMHRGGVPISAFVASDENALRAEAWVGRVRRALRDRRRRPRGEWDRIREGRREPEHGRGLQANRRKSDELATGACDRIMEMVVQGMGSVRGDGYPAGVAAAELASTLETVRRDAVRRGFWSQLHLLVNDRRFVDEILETAGAGDAVARPASHVPGVESPARSFTTTGTSVADFLASRVVHLGPLRQDPQLLYRTSAPRRRGDVGSKGEHAYAVLHRDADRVVSCPTNDGGHRNVPLADAVNYWLDVLELGCEVTTVNRPRLGLEPQLRMEGVARELNMTAVGVGVSQVLPVLVMGLSADPGTVLLLEQPELHLHPAVQQRLADFLLACSGTGRQVVVETHSDHLVTRLRRRIAEDEDDEVVSQVAIFASRRSDGGSELSPLAVNRFGGFDSWPEGFFDEGPRDAQRLVEAGMRKQNA